MIAYPSSRQEDPLCYSMGCGDSRNSLQETQP